MRAATAVALLLGASAILPARVAAQTIMGDVVAEESGAPLHAALVALEDSAGRRRLAVLTDSAGRFVLRASGPGLYRVVLSHIGRKGVQSESVYVAAGAVVRLHLEAAIAPLLLKPLVVDTRSRCEVRPLVGQLAFDLWQEARKAMEVSRVARGGFRGTIRMHHRELDPNTLNATKDSTWQEPVSAVRAFGSATEPELDSLGYVRRDGADWVYYGPDELVLGSDGFMDHHCLRPVKADKLHPGLVGVAFKPIQGSRPDIEGVAWLDGATAELRSVEFHYTSLPWSIPQRTQGGTVTYGRLASGAIAVTGWSLRSPQVQETRGFRAAGQAPQGLFTVLRVFENGGEALPADGSRAAPAPQR